MNDRSRPLRRFGQNFLVDRGVAQRIVGALSPTPGEPVAEIGPGRGALTELLISASGRIAAVELDRRMVEQLRQRFPEDQLCLIQGDVLNVPFERLLAALDAPARRLALVGNLPYNVSKPVAMKLVDERAQVDRAVLMFQREVAQRLTATAGSRAYGPLSVLVSRFYRVRRLADVPPAAFRPRPAVTSSVTLWTPSGRELNAEEETRLRRVLRVAFAGRRRTLRNNLRAAFRSTSEVEELLNAADIDGGLRAEQLSPEDFERLGAALPEA